MTFIIKKNNQPGMMRLLMLLILVVPAMLRAQGNNGQYMNFVFEANLPEEIYHFYDQKEIRTVYVIRTDFLAWQRFDLSFS